MTSLTDRVAVVTGATRGVGRGVARALAEAGVRVYATGRTIANAVAVDGVTDLPCDHMDDMQVDAVFRRVVSEAGRLDILVNSSWAGYERMVDEAGRFTWTLPFWEQPVWRWDAMVSAGARAAFVASQHAARLMVPARRGLIVNISTWAAQKYIGNVLYGVSKAATDKLTSDMAHELRAHDVAVISLYPGLVRTEAVLGAGVFDLSNSESPEFIGRAVLALASDANVLRHTGSVRVAAALALEYGYKDVDGAQPRPLTLSDV
jgi:NAD(P)-dependent dehydrogenase (short-subunit alcohol dehydrogenase family)